MYKALRLSPMIPSYNVAETAAFFKSLLGFNSIMDGNYTILQKDQLTIHILPAGDIGEMEFYLEVDNIEAVWENVKDKLAGTKFKAPFNQPYGMREIHIIVPHTKTLLFIGQAFG